MVLFFIGRLLFDFDLGDSLESGVEGFGSFDVGEKIVVVEELEDELMITESSFLFRNYKDIHNHFLCNSSSLFFSMSKIYVVHPLPSLYFYFNFILSSNLVHLIFPHYNSFIFTHDQTIKTQILSLYPLHPHYHRPLPTIRCRRLPNYHPLYRIQLAVINCYILSIHLLKS